MGRATGSRAAQNWEELDFYWVPEEGGMQSPLAPSKELCMVCPQPTQGAPQNPCPTAEWVPSLEGHSGGTCGWVKALT